MLFLPGEESGPSRQTYVRQHQVIIDLTRDFFDKYLRGKADTPLLKGDLDDYPELDFERSSRGRYLADQRVSMRDRVELSTDIHLPRGKGRSRPSSFARHT